MAGGDRPPTSPLGRQRRAGTCEKTQTVHLTYEDAPRKHDRWVCLPGSPAGAGWSVCSKSCLPLVWRVESVGSEQRVLTWPSFSDASRRRDRAMTSLQRQ